jgi:hypothetical protein
MMERPDHSMSNLFAQLGKPNDEHPPGASAS